MTTGQNDLCKQAPMVKCSITRHTRHATHASQLTRITRTNLFQVPQAIKLKKQLHRLGAAAQVGHRTHGIHRRLVVGAVRNHKKYFHVSLVAIALPVQHSLEDDVTHGQVAEAANGSSLHARVIVW